MKLKNLRLVLSVCVGILLASSARAELKNWATGDGNWSVNANWSPASVPTDTDNVSIVFADGTTRTVTYDYAGQASLGTVTIDLTGAGGNSSTLAIPGHTLTDGSGTVGDNGRGTVNQSGGLYNSSNLVIGNHTAAVGNFNLSGGTLNALIEETVGNDGTGVLTQTGGTSRIGTLDLGYSASGLGSYTLSGASALQADAEYVGLGATGNGTQSGGTFTQSGGSNQVTSLIMAAGSSATASYTLSSGTLNASFNEQVGYAGTATFNHSNGTNSANWVSIGSTTGANGTYSISGGTLNAGNIYVGGDYVGAGGTGTLTISSSSVVNVTGGVSIFNTPGSKVNFSSGTLATGAIDVQGIPSLFNWTGGTLEITKDVAWDSGGLPVSTSVIFGSSLALSSSRTLRVDGNETIGGNGSFNLTLNGGSTHSVAGDITLKPGGTLIEAGSGIALTYNNFLQAGGSLGNSFRNVSDYTYKNGGMSNLQFTNDGIATFAGNCSIGGTLQNNNQVNLTNGLSFSASSGITNVGTFNMNGASISSGLTNLINGYLDARGSISSTLTNHGTINVSGILTATTITNDGVIQGAGSVLNPQSSFSNSAGGLINATTPGGVLSFARLDNNLAVINVGPTSTLSITSSWSSSGIVNLQGSLAKLAGGLITNNGTIQGSGLIATAITNGNTGVVRANGGELDFASGSNVFLTTSQLQASASGTLMFTQGLGTNSGIISLSGGTFDNNAHALANNGTINGYGTIRTSTFTNSTNKLISVGEGNMDVFGAFTNNGVVNIQTGRSAYFYGTVNGSGNFTGGGTAVFLNSLSPGNSPALVNISGSATLVGGTALNMELGGTMPGSQYDQLHVGGALSIGGIFSLSLISGFMPAVGNSFDLLDWGTLSGTFSSLSLPTLSTGQWDTSQLYTTGVLSVIPIAGDYNGNGVVDAADYVAWRHGLGTTYPQTDYDIWRANFGNTAASGSGSQVAGGQAQVPEPTATLLGLLGLCNLAATRRGRS
jgi:hypothetical protein